MKLFGGSVNDVLIREADKHVPEGMKGSPDELFNFFKKMD
jgi:hypothetical protein